MGSGETGFRGYAVEFRTDLIQTACGRFATRDFGGSGPDLLFVHGTGHNLEVWSPLAERLRGQFRMVAFDLRGHGQTPEESTDPEQYWRDLGGLVSAMGLRRPLLVGHSTGGYAVSAYAAAVGECSGIVVLDGFVLDGRKTPEEAKGWYLPREQLWDLFRYGWVASGNDMERYIGEVCSKAPEDWLNAGVDPALVGAFTRRSFVQRGGRFVRRPSMEEIAAVSLPDEMPSMKATWSVVALALVCTGLAFVVFFRLIEEIGAARATVITFVNPVVAVALGAVFLDEPFTAAIVVGFVLVISGCWLATRPAPDTTVELAPEGAAVGS